MCNSLGNLGTVAGSYVFPTQWAPRYIPTWCILIACFVFGIVMLFVLRVWLVLLNKKMNKNGGAIAEAREGELQGSRVEVEGNLVAWRYQL